MKIRLFNLTCSNEIKQFVFQETFVYPWAYLFSSWNIWKVMGKTWILFELIGVAPQVRWDNVARGRVQAPLSGGATGFDVEVARGPVIHTTCSCQMKNLHLHLAWAFLLDQIITIPILGKTVPKQYFDAQIA